ncbi:putative pumilio-like protein 7, chloroplastic [Senna tora]|uniref:Putative pumilio-like protein 7, chloroplastic n=1 Tax=Senna tora TaxID=362788 RepID=A0A834TXT5_9FABA|nr:putative pumilio-like protein 7, chloroplastic [Senna tora]
MPEFFSPKNAGGDPVAFRCDNSFIIQGKDINFCIDHGYNSLKGFKNNSHNEIIAFETAGERVSKHNSYTPGSQICEGNGNVVGDFPLPSLFTFYSMAGYQGYVYNLAKDQNGCRFLQRMVDKGSSEDMQIVFEGIVDNVVELMMDPFGNYLVQKLLDVCREEQKLQIVCMVTKEPGQLVRISLNTHGTRVVQKLIETLNSRKQISLVKSALQAGFLDLIKDLNGNHVIQRCLQCLSCQDNEFIFYAAAKFCADIATHQHGCCVLQRCIDHSMGKYRDKLVTEICRHGLLLAQDPFGNYVVQYIIEMEIPTASAKLISQFKGNYVSLSTQKFSSHVVEKCLKHIGESRSRIVRELLSAHHFEQLLQDPYANYVIQSALAMTKGTLHTSLVDAVRPYKILRTSPYCKRIFSGNLLKK